MANINHQNHLGNTPLHHGFECGTSLEIVEYLLNSGANVHIRNYRGQSLFHVAAKSYHSLPEATDLLIDHGVSLKAIDDQGSSVLHEVLKNSSVTLTIIEKLLILGAPSDHRDHDGNPPLAYCESSNLSQEERLDAEKMLIQYSVLAKKVMIRKSFDESKDFGDTVVCFHFSADSQKRKEWMDYRDSCIKEILEMGKLSLESDSSLSEFLEGSISKNLTQSNLKFILIGLQKNLFPIFRDIVIRAIEESNFENFIEDLDWFVHKSISFKKKAIFLNKDCINTVIKFLSRKEIINLILAYSRF